MSDKRFVTIAEYQRRTGLSYQTVKNAAETGQIKAIQTEAGNWKIDVSGEGNRDTTAIIERLDVQERMLKALCGHLGLKQ
jgi:predicted site-specific integrase-resolvase